MTIQVCHAPVITKGPQHSHLFAKPEKRISRFQKTGVSKVATAHKKSSGIIVQFLLRSQPVNKLIIPEEMYTARQGVIQLIGVDALAQKTEEFRPILRAMCEEGRVTVIEAVDSLLQVIDSTDIDPELLKAVCVEILEPRYE